MPLEERIALARQALAQGLALLPIVLRALNIPRTSWDDQKQKEENQKRQEDQRLKALMEELLQAHPADGYRRLEKELSGPGGGRGGEGAVGEAGDDSPRPGGAFLSHDWVGRMLLGEGVRLSSSLLGTWWWSLSLGGSRGRTGTFCWRRGRFRS